MNTPTRTPTSVTFLGGAGTVTGSKTLVTGARSQFLVTHGEPEASRALCDRICTELGWPAVVPRQGERIVVGR